MFRIYNYATASSKSTVYIIGGIGEEYKSNDPFDRYGYDDYHGDITTIAEFKNNKWTKIGNLRQKRRGASALFLNGELIIAGGQVDKSHISRKCIQRSYLWCDKYKNPIPE